MASGVRAAFHGMALQLHGHHDLVFELWRKEGRDEVMSRINALCKQRTPNFDRTTSDGSNSESGATYESLINAPIHEGVGASTRNHAADILAPPKNALIHPHAFPDEALSHMPFVANKPWLASTRLTPRRFTCLTIGSRGDVQPYIALSLRLMQDGHKVTIVTHGELLG